MKLTQRGYQRSITGLYRVLRRQGIMAVTPPHPKYIPKPYEQMRYPGRVEWRIDADEEAKEFPILPLLLLTFVENVFKHGMIEGEVCVVQIQAACQERGGQRGLFISIEDNGSGISEEKAAALNEAVSSMPEKPDWSASCAFGDSASDLPLLRLLGRPYLVNPGRKARRKAAGRIPILSWKEIS